MPCFDTGYEVTSTTVTVPLTAYADGPQTYTLTAPTGKKPICGGFNIAHVQNGAWPLVFGSYPNGNDWVFKIKGTPEGSRSVTLYLISVSA